MAAHRLGNALIGLVAARGGQGLFRQGNGSDAGGIARLQGIAVCVIADLPAADDAIAQRFADVGFACFRRCQYPGLAGPACQIGDNEPWRACQRR